MAQPSRLGDPISDDSSADETSQIRGLEEDQGIYHHQEVDVPPQYESDDDIPINKEVQFTNVLEDRNQENMAELGRPQSVKAVRFTGNSYDDENSMESQEQRELIRDQESPHEPLDTAYEEAKNSPGPPTIPPISPPAYSSPQPEERVKEEKQRGSINELIMAKVSMPFQQMMRRSSRIEEDTESDDDFDGNPNDFTTEELQLLSFIEAYQPEQIELKPILKPFILDYIPAIGDIDAFIKIPRPDEVEDNIGLTQLDEPAVKQSDPTILDMQLRSVTKEVNVNEDAPVKRLDRADKNKDEIQNWITNIKELHRSRPSQSVQYKGPMPDIEKLMQEFNPQFEQAIRGLKIPTAELDVSLEEYTDICLNLMDIPVGKSRIQSLHLFFSLYSEFKNSQHFRNLAQNNMNDTYKDNMDRLEL